MSDDLTRDLREHLAALHLQAGKPSTRETSRKLGSVISHSTVGKVLRCTQLPSWGNLELVVGALAGDVETARGLWMEACRAREHGRIDPSPVDVPRTLALEGPRNGDPPPAGRGADDRIPATPQSRWDQLRQVSRRHRIVVVALATTCLVALTSHLWARKTDAQSVFSALCAGAGTDGKHRSVSVADSECIGLADTGDGFGEDPILKRLQRNILTNNATIGDPGRVGTIVWLGELSCHRYRVDGGCVYPPSSQGPERQALQGLLAFQIAMAGARKDAPRIVIGNAGSGMRHVTSVANMLKERTPAVRGRTVVIYSGDGSSEDREAISLLLDAGVPVVATALTDDSAAPGRPFVDRAGFLQLQPPNQVWARQAVSLAARYSARSVVIYRSGASDDAYADSLARDLHHAAQARGMTTEVVSDVRDMPSSSVCKGGPSASGRPAAVLFADRATRFAGFAEDLTTLCSTRGGPAMVVSPGPIDSVINNDSARAELDAPWPMAYLTTGKSCFELDRQTTADDPQTRQQASALLDTVRTAFGACDANSPGLSVNLGSEVARTWDAATLATALIASTPSPGRLDTLTASVSGATDKFDVQHGRMARPLVEPSVMCMGSLDLSGRASRSRDSCDSLFGRS